MAELKTKRTGQSVDDFLAEVADEARRDDCKTLLKMMKRITRSEPEMWGAKMVGFGSYTYQYASGRSGEWFVTAFSPRKRDLTVYIISGFGRYDELMAKLGKYKTGKSCLYLKRLEDVDAKVLMELIAASVKQMKTVGCC